MSIPPTQKRSIIKQKKKKKEEEGEEERQKEKEGRKEGKKREKERKKKRKKETVNWKKHLFLMNKYKNTENKLINGKHS